MNIKNWLYNATYTYLFWGLVGFLAKYSEVIAAFQEANFGAQLFVFTWITLASFIFIVKLKERILADGVITKKEKLAWYAALLEFLPLDASLNIVFVSPILLQPANSMGEGWLLTSHANAIRAYSLAKLDRGEKLTALEAWRFWHCEKWIGPLMNLVEKRHYS